MSATIKIFFSVIVTGLLTFFITREFCPKYEFLESSSDTTKTITTKVSTDENTFTAEQVGNIKRVLIDSLSEEYRIKIAAYQKFWDYSHSFLQPQAESSKPDSVYVSEIDSNFIAKDTSGNITDSIQVTSTFLSPGPLHESSIHLLNINHKSFTKEVSTETKITNTDVVEKKKNFLEKFDVSPTMAAGYGLINKQFDVFIGVGIRYEFDIKSIF